jgi:hypothetical protein
VSNLPKNIAIGALAYVVVDDTQSYAQTVVDFNEQTWGRVRHHIAQITLEPTQTDPHKRMALLHECLHACWHVTDPLDPNNAEEFAVRTLTGPLLDMLRRNPDLVAYLLAEDGALSTP